MNKANVLQVSTHYVRFAGSSDSCFKIALANMKQTNVVQLFYCYLMLRI